MWGTLLSVVVVVVGGDELAVMGDVATCFVIMWCSDSIYSVC